MINFINILYNENYSPLYQTQRTAHLHDDVIKWKHFPRNWPFVREIHRSPVNFPHKGQWRGALMFSLIYAWMNDWVNNREAGDLRRQHGHYDVIVMRIAVPKVVQHTRSSQSTTIMHRKKNIFLFVWHYDVIKWKHFPRYWPFVRGIHRSRWIPRTKASDAELWCFLWSAPE